VTAGGDTSPRGCGTGGDFRWSVPYLRGGGFGVAQLRPVDCEIVARSEAVVNNFRKCFGNTCRGEIPLRNDSMQVITFKFGKFRDLDFDS
jgi:hypothetical protein